jgi:transposase InsO family protein
MREEGLLKLENRINRMVPRQFVKYRKVITVRLSKCIEMDIKDGLIPQGKKRLFTIIIDVHTRRILKDYFSFSIKQNKVITFISDLFSEYQYPESVVIRSDNGSQFIAKVFVNT